MSTTALRRRTALGAVALGVITAVTVVVPVWVLLEWLFVAIDLAGHSLWIAAPVGLATTSLVLALPAVVWAGVVAALADVDRRPVALTTLRTAPPLALVVLVAVDLSQLFIDLVHPWHRLAVHALFTVAFAVGQATLHGVVAARVGRRVTVLRGAAPDGTMPGVARHVALASAVGVVVGGVLALTLGWRVRPAMGWDMLKPLYLVLVTGSLGAGTVLGRHLVFVSSADGGGELWPVSAG